ncbi:PH domain-containing protein [Bifidobacterium psychraerophilum]|uniref:Membrane protein n=1 Tax=Bifidobacterium psychraerophilum TaxID=218140 RepID=A0A087CBW9_9BIFI|nr:PH domain-containing protein [Bifidobacterium psychraerophilum]KFI80769.1 membrane protein [Bifidobacterium psychraerophilum]PKA93961.1 putative membrane protein [Bifidobacterium psychraerophilum DSM 22366]
MSAPAAGTHQADESGQGERSDGSNQKPRNASGSQESGQWRLLHPLVLVEDAIDGVKSSVSLIIAAAVVIFHFNPPHWVIWAFGAFVVVCACLIAPMVGYFSTRYRMTGESVEYRSGIVVRKHNIIAYSHIHAISSDEPFYYKPFSVVKLNIASAGTVAADMQLKAVPSDVQYELEHLRHARVSAQSSQASAQEGIVAGIGAEASAIVTGHVRPGASIEEEQGHGEMLYRASTADILLYALTDLRFLAAFVALIGLLDRIKDVISERLFDEAASRVTSVFTSGTVVVIALIVLVVIVLMVASVVNSMLQFYGFEVWRRKDDLVIVRGLLTRRRVTVPVNRIQSVGIRQSVIRRMLHLNSVAVALSASHGEDDDGDSTSISLLPVIRQRELIETIARVLPQWDIPNPQVQRTSRHLTRYLLFLPCMMTGLAVLAVILFAVLRHDGMALLWALLPLAIGALWCFFRWIRGRYEGFQLLDDKRIIVSGARGFALFWVVTRRSRIQSVERQTTVLRQRRGVERLTMPLFVYSGETELRFSVIHQSQAAQLQEWAMRVRS